LNKTVKRFGLSLLAVALFCTLSWAVPGANAASHTSRPKKDAPSPCLPTQVTVVERHATVCLNKGQDEPVIEVVSIHNGTNALAIFDNEDVHDVFVVEPGQTKDFPNFNSGRVKVLTKPCQ
jgi:hypothetical protein